MQWWAGGDVLLPGVKGTVDIASLRPRVHLLVVQTPKTVVILVRVRVALLSAAAPPPGPPEVLRGAPDPLLPLDLGAVEDVDGVGWQGEFQAV